MKVWFNLYRSNERDLALNLAFREAAKILGWHESNIDDCDIALWWGLPPSHKDWINRLNGKPYIIVEFPFWNRGLKNNIRDCFYKISIGGIYPGADIFWQDADDTRYKKTNGVKIKPWRKGSDIYVAGMGRKGSEAFNYIHGEWDIKAVNIIRKNSDKNIIYRKKPNDKKPAIIEKVVLDQCVRSLRHSICNAHALVTHHGHSAIDALSEGVPVFCNYGLGLLMGKSDLKQIESPHYPENRPEFFHQLAWWQWHFEEIKEAKPFIWMLDRGIL